MVPGGDPAFLDPNGTVKGVPEQATAEKTVSTPAVLAPEALISRPSPTPAAGAAAPVITPTPTPARSVQPVTPAQSTTVQSSTPTTPGR